MKYAQKLERYNPISKYILKTIAFNHLTYLFFLSHVDAVTIAKACLQVCLTWMEPLLYYLMFSPSKSIGRPPAVYLRGLTAIHVPNLEFGIFHSLINELLRNHSGSKQELVHETNERVPHQ